MLQLQHCMMLPIVIHKTLSNCHIEVQIQQLKGFNSSLLSFLNRQTFVLKWIIGKPALLQRHTFTTFNDRLD